MTTLIFHNLSHLFLKQKENMFNNNSNRKKKSKASQYKNESVSLSWIVLCVITIYNSICNSTESNYDKQERRLTNKQKISSQLCTGDLLQILPLYVHIANRNPHSNPSHPNKQKIPYLQSPFKKEAQRPSIETYPWDCGAKVHMQCRVS